MNAVYATEHLFMLTVFIRAVATVARRRINKRNGQEVNLDRKGHFQAKYQCKFHYGRNSKFSYFRVHAHIHQVVLLFDSGTSAPSQSSHHTVTFKSRQNSAEIPWRHCYPVNCIACFLSSLKKIRARHQRKIVKQNARLVVQKKVYELRIPVWLAPRMAL